MRNIRLFIASLFISLSLTTFSNADSTTAEEHLSSNYDVSMQVARDFIMNNYENDLKLIYDTCLSFGVNNDMIAEILAGDFPGLTGTVVSTYFDDHNFDGNALGFSDPGLPPTYTVNITTNKANPLKYEPIMFTSLVTDGNSDDLTYAWNFGDNTSSTLSSTSHTYDTAGNYTVTLSVDNGAVVKTMNVTIPDESLQPTLYSSVFPIIPPSQDGGGSFYTLSLVDQNTINTKIRRYFDMYYLQEAGLNISDFFSEIVDTNYIWNKNSYDSEYSVNDLTILDYSQEVNGTTIRILVSLDKLKSNDALMYYERKFKNKYLSFISTKIYTNGSITEETYTKSSSDDSSATEITEGEYLSGLISFSTTYNNLEVKDYGNFFDENTWNLIIDGI